MKCSLLCLLSNNFFPPDHLCSILGKGGFLPLKLKKRSSFFKKSIPLFSHVFFLEFKQKSATILLLEVINDIMPQKNGFIDFSRLFWPIFDIDYFAMCIEKRLKRIWKLTETKVANVLLLNMSIRNKNNVSN